MHSSLALKTVLVFALGLRDDPGGIGATTHHPRIIHDAVGYSAVQYQEGSKKNCRKKLSGTPNVQVNNERMRTQPLLRAGHAWAAVHKLAHDRGNTGAIKNKQTSCTKRSNVHILAIAPLVILFEPILLTTWLHALWLRLELVHHSSDAAPAASTPPKLRTTNTSSNYQR